MPRPHFLALIAVAAVGSFALLFASGCGSGADGGDSETTVHAGGEETSPAAGQRLFAPTSVWNQPLAASAPTDPASGRIVAALVGEVQSEERRGIGPWIATKRCSTPLYVVPADQPTVAVELSHPHASWRVGLATAFRRVPLPADAQPAQCVDRHLTVWQPSTDRLWEFFHLRQEGGAWRADWGGAMKHASRSPGFYTNGSWPGLSTPNWGATATSLPVAAGVMLLRELRAGHVDHALAMNVPVARAGAFSWPAQRSDGSGPADAIPEGARLRLDPSLDLNSLRLPPVTLMIARAAQRYGMIVRDQTGTANGISLFAEDVRPPGRDPYDGPRRIYGGLTAGQILAAFPWDRLQLLKLDLCREAPCRR